MVALLLLGCGGAAPGPSSGEGGPAALVQELEGPSGNRPPRFLTMAPLTAQEGRLYRYGFHAEDPDGDEVSYSLVEAPEGAFLEGEELRWCPAPGQGGGFQEFTLRAVDEWGAVQDQVWRVLAQPQEEGGRFP